MRISFSAWAIRNPVPPILLFSVLCVLGIMSFMRLPVTKFPNIDVPVISVTMTQSGAAPAELESQITKEVEDAVVVVPVQPQYCDVLQHNELEAALVEQDEVDFAVDVPVQPFGEGAVVQA